MAGGSRAGQHVGPLMWKKVFLRDVGEREEERGAGKVWAGGVF